MQTRITITTDRKRYEYHYDPASESAASVNAFIQKNQTNSTDNAFKLTISNDGTTPDGPCRVMTVTAIVGLKQVVGKDMNA